MSIWAFYNWWRLLRLGAIERAWEAPMQGGSVAERMGWRQPVDMRKAFAADGEQEALALYVRRRGRYGDRRGTTWFATNFHASQPVRARWARQGPGKVTEVMLERGLCKGNP